jgi:hypothetical protein
MSTMGVPPRTHDLRGFVVDQVLLLKASYMLTIHLDFVHGWVHAITDLGNLPIIDSNTTLLD